MNGEQSDNTFGYEVSVSCELRSCPHGCGFGCLPSSQTAGVVDIGVDLATGWV